MVEQERVAVALAGLDVTPSELQVVTDGRGIPYGCTNWRQLTRNMTTEQREAVADAVERRWAAIDADDPSCTHDASREDLRWWRT